MLIGGAVGVGVSFVLPTPLAIPAALGLGVLSHHLLDFIPHTDAATFWPDASKPIPRLIGAVVAIEVLVGLVLTGALFISQHMTLTFLCGAVGGIVPDVLDEVPWWQQRFRRTTLGGVWHRWHLRWHCASMEKTWLTGIIIDAFVIGAGLWLLLP
jgi:hypothetical protein